MELAKIIYWGFTDAGIGITEEEGKEWKKEEAEKWDEEVDKIGKRKERKQEEKEEMK